MYMCVYIYILIHTYINIYIHTYLRYNYREKVDRQIGRYIDLKCRFPRYIVE